MPTLKNKGTASFFVNFSTARIITSHKIKQVTSYVTRPNT